jgi:hypothetical protein
MVSVAYNLQTVSFNCCLVSCTGLKYQTNPNHKSLCETLEFVLSMEVINVWCLLLETVGGNNYNERNWFLSAGLHHLLTIF